MANFKKPGKKVIGAGERDLEKGILGPRGYNIVKGSEDVIKGEKIDRSAKRKRK
ncbi:MAG: hypothetical protein ACYDAO_05265 [Thermoplasmataceae archaeon]